MDSPTDLVALFGGIDVYLFDQLLRGRIRPGMRVLDAGCGGGRNLVYLLQAGYEVSGLDANADALASARQLARERSPGASESSLAERFRVEQLEDCSFEPRSFDLVICNAVLHFARDEAHFLAMLSAAWSTLRVGGVFFARLASSIGIEDRVRALGGGRYGLPDGSQRYLVDEEALLEATRELGGELLDPIKTTNVQNLRCMTTWVLRRVQA